MAVGLSLKLPLSRNNTDGLALIKTVKGLVKQQLKMLVLTNPGEMIMDLQYGCGVEGLLFEQVDNSLMEQVEERIYSQAEIYMKHITVTDIDFAVGSAGGGFGNLVRITINYNINSLGTSDALEVNFDQ